MNIVNIKEFEHSYRFETDECFYNVLKDSYEIRTDVNGFEHLTAMGHYELVMKTMVTERLKYP